MKRTTFYGDKTAQVKSLPSWERGLKLMDLEDEEEENIVAPFVGAWIETSMLAIGESKHQGRSLRGGLGWNLLYGK